MAVLLGIDGKLFCSGTNGAGASNGADWVEQTCVRSVSLSQSASEADTTTRAAGGYKTQRPGLKELSVEVEIPYDPTNAQIIAIEAAWNAKTSMGWAVANGTPTNTSNVGIKFDGCLFSFDLEQGQDGEQIVKATIKPNETSAPTPI